jgi:hypothetical protein
MKNLSAHWAITAWLGLGALAIAQEPRLPTAAVEGIKGVKQEAVAEIKNVEPGNAGPSDGVASGTKSNAQGVNKINGVETINGVKGAGRTVIPPPPPGAPPPPPPPSGVVQPATSAKPVAPPPPPPPVVSAGGTALPAGGGSVGSTAHIRAVQGVAGINTAKLQNLEKALVLKQGGGGTPSGAGAEKGGKGKSAAAALLAAPLEKQPGPKEDGRAGFQEFEKLQNNGS